MASKIIFVLSDQLPTIYDVAIQIHEASHKIGPKRNEAVNAYFNALEKLWIKIFGKDYIQLQVRSNIINHINNILNDYNTNVILNSYRCKKSIRVLNKEWKNKPVYNSKTKQGPKARISGPRVEKVQVPCI